MAALSAGRDARPVAGNAEYYERHRPEQTLLYPIVAEFYPAFQDLMAAQGRTLPEYVQREFDAYVESILGRRIERRSPGRPASARDQFGSKPGIHSETPRRNLQ